MMYFKKITQRYRFYRKNLFRNYIFIHINKTAGTSIGQALRLSLIHHTAQEWQRLLGKQYWEKKFTFCFVRNPWDKVVSHYHYRRKRNRTNIATDNIGFNEWVKEIYVHQNPKYYDKPKMFMPQLDWITDDKGQIVVSFIGRFENLQQDFDIVCDNIKVARKHLGKDKSSDREKDFRTYYDYNTIKIVEKCFRKDIEYFGYKF